MLGAFKRYLKLLGGRCFKLALPLFPNCKGISIIVAYHRVVDKIPDCFTDDALFVTAGTFEMHLEQLKRHFEILSLTDLLRPSDGRRACAITFDDGWIDNYEVAFPILKKYDIPATIFLPVGLVGSSKVFWFQSIYVLATKARTESKEQHFIEYFQQKIDSWRAKGINSETICRLISQIKMLPADCIDPLIEGAYERLGIKQLSDRCVLNWDEIAKMAHNRVSYGPHGLNHYILSSVQLSVKRREIIGSMELLKEKGISLSPIFSYPNGEWDDDCFHFLIEKNYIGAVTTRLGYNTSQTCRFLLNRILFHESISNTPSLFWYRIFQSFLGGAGPYLEDCN